MKRLIVGLFFLAISHFAIGVGAVSYSYRWHNTFVDVPINSSIYDYTNIPKADFYIDNVKQNDAIITYNREGDWLYYLKDVDTTKPGQYKVWYKAYENKYRPGTCPNYKALITFNVIDNIAPTINLFNESVNISVGIEEYDYTTLFEVKDNSSSVKIYINDEGVDYTQIGTYEVMISATDSSGNSASAILIVNVLDMIGPVVNYLGEGNKVELERGDKLEIEKYFQAIDAEAGDVTHNYEIQGEYNLNNVGTYNISIRFSDGYNYSQPYFLTLEVKDAIPPVLTISQTLYETSYLTEFSEEIWRRFIVEASDAGEDLSDQVIIDDSEVVNAVGNYQVYFRVRDQKGNETLRILKVRLISREKPTLIVEDVEVEIGENIDYEQLITVSDASDSDVRSTLVYDTKNVDLTKVGTYYVPVSCHNSSGEFAEALIKVTVIDSSKVEINFFQVVLIGLAVVVGGIIIFILYRRKQRKNDDMIAL